MRRRKFVATVALSGIGLSAGCSSKSPEDYEREGASSESGGFFQSVMIDELTGETMVTVADDLRIDSKQGREPVVAESISVVRDGRLVGQVQTVSSVSEYEFPYLNFDKYVLVARGSFVDRTVNDGESVRHLEVSVPISTEDVTFGEETIRVLPAD